jgi:hypothetical protein
LYVFFAFYIFLFDQLRNNLCLARSGVYCLHLNVLVSEIHRINSKEKRLYYRGNKYLIRGLIKYEGAMVIYIKDRLSSDLYFYMKGYTLTVSCLIHLL